MTLESEINLEELYKDVILDHYANPRNDIRVPNASATAFGHNPLCGDKIELTVKFDSKDQLSELGAQISGCSICKASGSMMCEELEGKTLRDAECTICRFRTMMNGGPAIESESGDLEALEGVKKFPVRIKCALLPWVTLEEAIGQHRGKTASMVKTEEATL